MKQTITENPEQLLTLKDFGFSYDESQVAQNPLPQRDASKLMVWDGHKTTHDLVKNLYHIVPAHSLFIVNNSRVIASRIHGQIETGAKVEILLLEPISDEATNSERWLCLGKPMRKLKPGMLIKFAEDLEGKIISLSTQPAEGPTPFTVELNLKGQSLLNWLDRHGEMPLPPYIERKHSTQKQSVADRHNYQTVYSQGLGSVAAPTAGLHFTPELMDDLKSRGCEFFDVTLHVGAGTFLPVKTEDPARHTMHSERFLVPTATYDALCAAKADGRPVIAVGTTSLRSLEGLAHLASQHHIDKSELLNRWLRTDIFIRPTYRHDRFRPWAVNYLMTNFHQPESTLFMLVCALVGFDVAHKIYTEAIRCKYRLFSYGDSSLLSLN
jgi:S-adenosylmethionine:tRNA ribosyltransferase-isomerase